MASKLVTADYYYVTALSTNEEDRTESRIIDLAEVITQNFCSENANCAASTKRKVTIDSGKLQMCYKHDEGFYELQFLYLRESDRPQIAKDTGELEELTLDDGTYLSESASCLFDPEYNIAVLQKNGRGAHCGFVERYLNVLLNPFFRNSAISLQPIMGGNEYGKIVGKRIKKIDCTAYFVGQPNNINSVFLPLSAMKPRTIFFSARSGRSTLEQETAHKTIDELRSATEVESLKVGYVDVDNDVKIANLMDDRISDSFILRNISKENPIRHSDIFSGIKQEYLRRDKEAGGFRRVR